MNNLHTIGGFGERRGIVKPFRQVPVAYGRLALSGSLPAGQWGFSPQRPFRPTYLLTWLRPGALGRASLITAFQIAGLDQAGISQLEGTVRASAFEATISIEAFLGHYLRCTGSGECPYCKALATRPAVLELVAAERVATPPGFAINASAVEVGGRLAIEHGELQGLVLIGTEVRDA